MKVYLGFVIHILICFIGLFVINETIVYICMITGVIINGYYVSQIKDMKRKDKQYRDLIESLVNALLVVSEKDYSIEDELGQEFLNDVLKLVD